MHPIENTDLAASLAYRERLECMQKQINDWLVSIAHSLNGKDYNK